MKERIVSGAIRAQPNSNGLKLNCSRMLHESLLIHTLMYRNERV